MLGEMRSSLSGQGASLSRYGLARNGASLGMGVPSKSIESKIRAMLAKGWQGAWNAPNESISAPWYQNSAATTPITAVAQFIGNARDKGGRGNHAIQATAAARPALSARVNVLLKSELFTDATWQKRGTGTASATPAPDGTGQLISGIGATGVNDIFQSIVIGGSAGIRMEPQLMIWPISTVGAMHWRNAATVANGLWVLDMSRLTPGQWNLVTRAHPAVTISTEYTKTAGGIGLQIVAPVGGPLSFYAKGAQIEYGTVPTRQQWVDTSTDYDTDGFQKYEKFDGIDDNLGSPTGGGGTAGFFFCQAVKPTGGAGTVRRLLSDRVAASFTGYSVQINASNQLEISAGNGAAYTSIATAGTLAVGTTAMITAWDDGTNLNVQIDGLAVASIGRPVVIAGTAGFTLGKDNGAASGFFTGNAYASLYRIGPVMTLPEIANAQTYIRQQAGL